MAANGEKLSIMVSSTVYDIRSTLKQIFAVLEGYGYDVWMSDRQTVVAEPDQKNFANCLAAVEHCDLFLGIITPYYGTGVYKAGELSITHQELLKAIELEKPRFMLCHQAVWDARSLLNTLAHAGQSLKGAKGRAELSLTSKSVLRDLKTIDMLEAALREDIEEAADRTNNWVGSFEDERSAMRFVESNLNPAGRISAYLGRVRAAKGDPDAAGVQANEDGNLGKEAGK